MTFGGCAIIIPVFTQPTQPGHPSMGRCDEYWRWFRPLLGKKRRVLCSIAVFRCWNAGLSRLKALAVTLRRPSSRQGFYAIMGPTLAGVGSKHRKRDWHPNNDLYCLCVNLVLPNRTILATVGFNKLIVIFDMMSSARQSLATQLTVSGSVFFKILNLEVSTEFLGSTYYLLDNFC